MKQLVNILAILIIVVALVCTPAAALLVMHYGMTGDLAKFEWLIELTTYWSVFIILAAAVLGSLLG